MLLLPFIWLVVVIVAQLPGGAPSRQSLIGKWVSPAEAPDVVQPLVLELDAEGNFELRLTGDDAVALTTRVKGRYEIRMGRLVMVLPGHKMVWSIGDRELRHTTKQGFSYRLQRS